MYSNDRPDSRSDFPQTRAYLRTLHYRRELLEKEITNFGTENPGAHIWETSKGGWVLQAQQATEAIAELVLLLDHWEQTAGAKGMARFRRWQYLILTVSAILSLILSLFSVLHLEGF